MSPIESEITTIKGEFVARTQKPVPEEVGEYPIGDSSFTINKIIPGKRNGRRTIKAIIASFNPPFSDGREQRFTLNGSPTYTVPPEAENTLGGGLFKARLRLTEK